MKTLLTCAAALAASASLGSAAQAQQIEAYLGDVILVGYDFCPRDWASAEGQLLPISQYTALFSLVGTTYGGDGQTSFGLPDLRGRYPVHHGQGDGLTNFVWGQQIGADRTTLTAQNLPPHTHAMRGNDAGNDVVNPGGAAFTTLTGQGQIAFSSPADTALDSDTVGVTGGGAAMNVHAPSLGMRYCVALAGMYPQRN